MARPSWGSRIGFIFAVAGSAVGLANIWRFPYIVGQYGGSAFVILYLICLFAIGFPVFMAETLIGRTAQTSPSGAFQLLGNNKNWSWAGKLTILTGFIVSSFYSAVAGWVLGYLIEAIKGNVSSFASTEEVAAHHVSLMTNPYWGVAFHFFFLLACISILYLGVRNGIEKGSKIMMPLLFIVLIFLVINGLLMPNAKQGLEFLLKPNWSLITPTAVLLALGQSFFTLSIGQGTLVTYGSYLKPDDNLVKSCYPVVIMDTLVSLLSAVAVFTIVFSAGLQPDQGPGLIFHTLPWVFSHLPAGHFLAVMFFLLVVLAATTSEISALEPSIAYLIDVWKLKRHQAVIITGLGAFILGIPCALSTSVLADATFQGMTFLDWADFIANSILIPLGGLLAVILVGWVWGTKNSIDNLKLGSNDFFSRHPWLSYYFWICFKFIAPILIILVFLNALGIFS